VETLAADPGQSEKPTPRRRMSGESWQGYVERQIKAAQERGLFDDLPGHGEPLRLDDVNPYAAERELAHKLLKDHGYAPDWIETDKSIRRELERIRRRLADSYPDSGAIERLTGQIDDLNAKIDLYNLKAPGPSFHRRRIVLTDEIRRLEQESAADE
jgi:hypothetical protein